MIFFVTGDASSRLKCVKIFVGPISGRVAGGPRLNKIELAIDTSHSMILVMSLVFIGHCKCYLLGRQCVENGACNFKICVPCILREASKSALSKHYCQAIMYRIQKIELKISSLKVERI